MSRAMLIVLALAFPLTALGADDLEIAIVSGVETFHRMHGASNLYPWDHAAPGEIIVSNACGFARIDYHRIVTADYSSISQDSELKPWSAMVLLGEWCRIGEFIHEVPTLVAYREWKGKNYVVSYAETSVDDSRLYIDDWNFIEKMGLEKLARHPGDSQECRTDPKQCVDRVYLSDLPAALNGTRTSK